MYSVNKIIDTEI